MKKLLFVCIENARRSQMAEGFFNNFVRGHSLAASAGTRIATKVDEKAMEVMGEVEIDKTGQRPKALTQNMVKEADVIVTMGCGAEVCPVVPKRTEEWKIVDPAGKPVETFREVRDETSKRVEKIIESLERRG